MKILEFTDNRNNKINIPLLKSIFKSISYPLINQIPSAQLVSNNNEIITLEGTNFKIINLKDCEVILND